MSKIIFVPGKPAVTRVVEPATEATITLTLSPREAGMLRALLGQASWSVPTDGIFGPLSGLARAGRIPTYEVIDEQRVPPIRVQLKKEAANG